MTDGLTDAELNALMDASAAALGLRIRLEWRDAVRTNLAVTFRLGSQILALDIPDEAEPAPVFRA
jgi:hypothetical protein